MKPAIKEGGAAILIFSVSFFLLLAQLPLYADSLQDISETSVVSTLSTTKGVFSASPYSSEKMSHVEIFRFEYRSSGLTETAYLAMPPGKGERWPVVIFLPGDGGINGRVLTYVSRLASKGPFNVLAVQYRGLDGSEGRDEYGGRDVDDVLHLISIARRLSFAGRRIGLLGFSRGGMMAYLALKKGAAVEVAAVVSAPTDLTETYDHLSGLRGFFIRRHIRTAIGGSPRDVPDRYKDRSARFWPERIHVPTLILQGDRDLLIPPAQVRQFGKILLASCSRCQMVFFKNGDHMLHRFPDDRDRKIVAWFRAGLRVPERNQDLGLGTPGGISARRSISLTETPSSPLSPIPAGTRETP